VLVCLVLCINGIFVEMNLPCTPWFPSFFSWSLDVHWSRASKRPSVLKKKTTAIKRLFTRGENKAIHDR
jgi:hypothetical protein